jgi:cytochrome c biogenesis protein CcdA
MKKFLFSLLLLVVAAYPASEIYFFYAPGCHACDSLEPYLDSVAADYSNVELKKLNIFENSTLLLELSGAHGLNTTAVQTPTTFVNDLVFIGYSTQIVDQITAEVISCQSVECPAVQDALINETESGFELEFGIVSITALADAVNPCEFAVLILMLTTIMASGDRKRALKAGLAFASAIYIAYLLMGLGLLTVIKGAGISSLLFSVIGIFAIVVGLLNLKDYWKPGAGGFIMEVPVRWRPKMKSIIKGTTSVPGAFITGLAVSLFLTPCTSGPYIFILSLIAEKATYVTGITWLLYYNLIFIAPMILITLLVYKGFTSPQSAEKWRKQRVRYMHLFAGVMMVALGAYILLLGPL